jgi:predicted metalloprotease
MTPTPDLLRGYRCPVTQQQWGTQPQRGLRGQSSPGAGQWTQGGAPWTQGSPPWGQAGPWVQPNLNPSNYGLPPQQPGFGAVQFGQPQYAPGQFTPPPVRRRSPLRGLLLALIGITLLALIGIAASNLVSSPATIAFENNDYQVPPPDKNPPPLPEPKTYAEAQQIITGSTFYQQAAPIPVRCQAQPVNVSTASDDQLKSHFESLMECLVRVWQPPLAKAGFVIVRPTVTIYGKDITTKCGKEGVNAFYCAGDQQVYFSDQLPDFVAIVKQDKWAADVVMAHEFGHELQARTAILISAHALGQNSGDDATNLQMSRRLETQADCFSGMFIRAVSLSLGVQQSDLDSIENTYVAVGDDTLTGNPDKVGDHGLARSRKYWGTTGLGTSDVGKCNTFAAGSALVR